MSRPAMSQWFSAREYHPATVGEYNASRKRDPHARRWWGGESWSMVYYDGDPPAVANQFARRRAKDWIREGIEWRGLANKPRAKKVTP